jgi:predicted secreted protein
MQVNVATQAAAVAAAGVLLGLFITITLRRRTITSEQAAGRWRALYAGAMLVCAALLLFIAIAESTRRYVNIAIAVALVASAMWQLRKRTNVPRPGAEPPSSPD